MHADRSRSPHHFGGAFGGAPRGLSDLGGWAQQMNYYQQQQQLAAQQYPEHSQGASMGLPPPLQMPPSLPVSGAYGTPNGMPSMAQGWPEGLPHGMAQEMMHGMQQDMLHGMPQGAPQGMQHELPHSLPSSLPSSFPATLPASFFGGTPNGAPPGMPGVGMPAMPSPSGEMPWGMPCAMQGAPTQLPPRAPAQQAAAGAGTGTTPSPPAEPTQEELRNQQSREAAELRRQVENSEGYFEPPNPLGHRIMTETGRYTIVDSKALGVGIFSVVWPCADAENKLVALKVIRSQDHFRRYAEKEVAMLKRAKQLEDKDPEGSSQVAMLRDHFIHKVGEVEHLCMSFEKLESNLRSVGKQPLDKVLKFSKQILVALRFLHDVVGLVHCDIKPDNLLLRWDGLSVKLCDFGTARTLEELQAVDELQPLFYRAPEVFLGATRGRKIDLWSAGCTFYELAVGRILFRSCNTHREVVEKSMQLCGPIPVAVRENGRLTRAYWSPKGFHPEVGEPVDADKTYRKTGFLSTLMGSVDFGKENAKSASELAQAQLSKLIGRTTVIGAAQKKRKGAGMSDTEQRVRQLADLIEKCMDIDPTQRITAAQAVQHDVFKAVELPPAADLREAPPLPEEAPPPLPPQAPPDDDPSAPPSAAADAMGSASVAVVSAA